MPVTDFDRHKADCQGDDYCQFETEQNQKYGFLSTHIFLSLDQTEGASEASLRIFRSKGLFLDQQGALHVLVDVSAKYVAGKEKGAGFVCFKGHINCFSGFNSVCNIHTESL